MRAAIYVRQSLDRSGEALAVGRQLTECRELVETHGWIVGEVYTDNDASATSRKPRPAWSKLLVDLEAGRVDVLVCWHTDRLYRRLRDLVDLVEIAEQRALRIATVRASDLDLSTPAGRMLASMLGSAARYEVEQKGARQVAANRARAQRGVSIWTRRPFGYDRNGHTVRVVEAEATEIRTAAAKVLAGETLASVAADLNGRGVPTSVGGRWTVTTVRRILLSPRVAGRVAYCGEDMGASGLGILDEDTADQLGALLRDPGRRAAPSTRVKYLLSGLARCGRDGEVMYATTNGADKVPVYRCRTCYAARRRDLVDQVVTAAVIARLSRPDAVDLLAEDVDVSRLRADVDELRGRRDGLAALLAEGLLTSAATRAQATKLTERIAAAEREIANVTGSSPLAEILTSDDVVAALDTLPLIRVREVIRTLLDVQIMSAGKGVRFAPDQVQLRWLS